MRQWKGRKTDFRRCISIKFILVLFVSCCVQYLIEKDLGGEDNWRCRSREYVVTQVGNYQPNYRRVGVVV